MTVVSKTNTTEKVSSNELGGETITTTTTLAYSQINKVLISKVERLSALKNDDKSSTTSCADHKDGSLPNFESHELIGTPSGNDDCEHLVLVDTVRKPGMDPVSRAFYAAGPRRCLHFQRTTVNAAIVTCGGLCPGMNNVIRTLVHTLYNLYSVQQVWGVTGGWNGFHLNNPDFEPVLLTNELVHDIHHQGGSFLSTSRGGLDIDKTVEFLQSKNICQLYIIGGDGTHRAAYKVHEACMARKLNVAVAGIPKTIDNDIAFTDRTFGFQSAVEAAQEAIRTGFVEAKCTLPNGIAVIKLMGRSAGFLAAYAALGSGVVDAVLVPEVPIVLDGPNGLLPFIHARVRKKKYAVVVVAEGAGEELLGETAEKEAGSGNKKLPAIAEWIRDRILEYFTSQGDQARMKFIDPSYLVRSVPANASDSLYCSELAENAVHGAMSGFTGFSVGLVNNKVVYIPIPQLVESSPRHMNPYSTFWKRVLAMTGQPNTLPPQDTMDNGATHGSLRASTQLYTDPGMNAAS